VDYINIIKKLVCELYRSLKSRDILGIGAMEKNSIACLYDADILIDLNISE
jgi:hypothetical protein